MTTLADIDRLAGHTREVGVMTDQTLKLSTAQRAKVERNGGSQWVRSLIDAAPETK